MCIRDRLLLLLLLLLLSEIFNTCWQTEQPRICYGGNVIAKTNLTMVITSKHKQLAIHSQQSTMTSAQRHRSDDSTWNWAFQQNWFGWTESFPWVDTSIIIIIVIIISFLFLQATISTNRHYSSLHERHISFFLYWRSPRWIIAYWQLDVKKRPCLWPSFKPCGPRSSRTEGHHRLS